MQVRQVKTSARGPVIQPGDDSNLDGIPNKPPDARLPRRPQTDEPRAIVRNASGDGRAHEPSPDRCSVRSHTRKAPIARGYTPRRAVRQRRPGSPPYALNLSQGRSRPWGKSHDGRSKTRRTVAGYHCSPPPPLPCRSSSRPRRSPRRRTRRPRSARLGGSRRTVATSSFDHHDRATAALARRRCERGATDRHRDQRAHASRHQQFAHHEKPPEGVASAPTGATHGAGGGTGDIRGSRSAARHAEPEGRVAAAQGSRAWPVRARRASATFFPAAWAVECPVTAARNASRCRAYSWESTVALTVAVRGTSRRSAISPK